MDALSLALKRKRERSNGKDDTHELDRSLNDFPDAILKHILSFLGTKHAVQTSILCKRWKFIWTSLPDLVFVEQEDESEDEGEDESLKTRKHFLDFVDRVLHLHDAPRIRKFSLHCQVKDDVSRIKTWISVAVRHNAEEIDLALNKVPKNVFPYCLFSSESLEVLRIEAGVVHLPSEIFLPRLKILTLTFKDYLQTNLLGVFFSQALIELGMVDSDWRGRTYDLIISAPKLCCLTISDRDELFSPVELPSCSITIVAPELKIFNYTGGFTKAYRLPCAPSIYRASFDFQTSLEPEEMRIDSLEEVLRSLRLLEELQLTTPFVKAMSFATVPVFENLISLEISERPVDLSCKEVEGILNKCQRLETLIFPMGISGNCNFDRLLNSKFTFLSSTLKNITIGAYNGSFTESSVVNFLLANATFLENMKIFCMIKKSRRKQMENVLSFMPRASKSCKLDLHFV